MKSLNTKLLLSALGIALLATPAFAQRPYRHAPTESQYNYQNPVGVYPNGASRSGSAESVESGAEFNVIR
jgi:hypothetical protein